jgi:hypothetical protein
MTLNFLALQGDPYTYDISRLRVKQRVVNLTPGSALLRFCAGPRLVLDTLAKTKFAVLLADWITIFRLFRLLPIHYAHRATYLYTTAVCLQTPLVSTSIILRLGNTIFAQFIALAPIMQWCNLVTMHSGFCCNTKSPLFENRNVRSLYGPKFTCAINCNQPTDKMEWA